MSEHRGFRPSERVTRRANPPYDQRPTRHGFIAERYYDYTSRFGPYPELYAVQFDGEPEVDRGFLRHGLEPEGHTP